ncbi:hypothetical protein E2562_019380 [Oryza meyeriana var. granulata]|uniref:Uncharacterized protein n=1 Tax=Oryza meyeriana var. granulata TaxID=110450 RepID=A0A6G1BM50_9ORYZ|nr:hypothetical protein E2562_019380 [Oryza meyeriana var. granulata]
MRDSGKGTETGGGRGGRDRGDRPASQEELCDLNTATSLDASFFLPASTSPRQPCLPALAACLLGVAEHLQLSRLRPSSTSSSPTHGCLAPRTPPSVARSGLRGSSGREGG